MTMEQRSKAPIRKVSVGAGAGSATVVLVWVAGQFGIDVPPEIASALTVLLSFAASYATPPAQEDGVTPTRRA